MHALADLRAERPDLFGGNEAVVIKWEEAT